jgi:hypothetical protein
MARGNEKGQASAKGDMHDKAQVPARGDEGVDKQTVVLKTLNGKWSTGYYMGRGLKGNTTSMPVRVKSTVTKSAARCRIPLLSTMGFPPMCIVHRV